MRLTQGTFSFLPDLTDEQIEAQIRWALAHGWAMSVEHTDDPHPRSPYWEMWSQPLFDLEPEDHELAMRQVRACRDAHPDSYIKLLAYDSTRGRQTTALSFIVNRPASEPGFRAERTEAHDRVMRYRWHAYAADVTEPGASRREGEPAHPRDPAHPRPPAR